MKLSIREKRLIKDLEQTQAHIGYTVQFYSDSTVENYGIVERVVIQKNIEAIALYLKAHGESVFSRKIFLDQVKRCSCQVPTVNRDDYR